MLTTTHNGTIKNDGYGNVLLKCSVYRLVDNTKGDMGWHICNLRYDFQYLPESIKTLVRENCTAAHVAEQAAKKPATHAGLCD